MGDPKNLTPEQLKLKEEYRKESIKIRTCTDPADRDRAEKAVEALYRLNGYKKPRLLWAVSPYEAEVFITILQKKGSDLGEKELRDLAKTTKPSWHGTWCWGQWDAYWVLFYLWCREVGAEYGKELDAKLDAYSDVVRSCNLVYTFDEVAVMTERPEKIGFNGTLHCDGGPALQYRDGYSLWSLNGVRVPREIAETPAHKLDPRIILKERNAEIRREIVRKVGIEPICKKLGAEQVDEAKAVIKGPMDKDIDVVYQLLLLDLGDNRKRPYLKMLNPSNGTYVIEGVPPGIKTVEEALSFRNDGDTTLPFMLT